MTGRISIAVVCLFSCLIPFLPAQDLPGCNASSIRPVENSIDFSIEMVQVRLEVDSVRTDIVSNSIQHDYFLGMDISESFDFPLGSEVAFSHQFTIGTHRFTIINNCSDGTLHTGASYTIDYADANFECPPILNLVIDILTDDFISFFWDFAPAADRYRVTYLADGIEINEMDTPEPFF